MTYVALRGEVTRSFPRSDEPDDAVEFGHGLRARLESSGVMGSGDAVTQRLAFERKLLAALPELAGVRGGSVSRLRVPHIPFATLVYQARLLPAEPLEAALAEAERTNEPIGQVLTRTGLLNGREVERLLAEQRGLVHVDLRRLDLDARLAGALPERTARLFDAVAIGYLAGTLVVAVADATDDVAMESIANQAAEPVTFVAAPRDDVAHALDRLYGASEAAA